METNNSKFKILAIEDDPDAMECIRKSLPTGYELIPSDSRSFSDICKHGLKGECMVGESDSFTRLDIELKKLIEENYSNLKAIVCDVKLGEQKEYNNIDEGVKVIEWIRNPLNEINLSKDYLKYIPIIVFSSLSNATRDRQDRAVGAGATGYVPKNDAEISAKRASETLQALLQSQANYFDYIYKTLNKKEFKVALSFTGNRGTELHREYIEEVASYLSTIFTCKRVFFDRKQLESGKTISYSKEDFRQIYKNRSEYIIVFISRDYNTKDSPWTQKEWEGIKEYYKVSKHQVIFVVLDKGFTEIDFKKKMDIEPVIWLDASEYIEDFYKIRKCKDSELKEKALALARMESTIIDYTSECIDIYKKKCVNTIERIVNAITKKIEDLDFRTK